jgi:hypothetical protein
LTFYEIVNFEWEKMKKQGKVEMGRRPPARREGGKEGDGGIEREG